MPVNKRNRHFSLLLFWLRRRNKCKSNKTFSRFYFCPFFTRVHHSYFWSIRHWTIFNWMKPVKHSYRVATNRAKRRIDAQWMTEIPFFSVGCLAFANKCQFVLWTDFIYSRFFFFFLRRIHLAHFDFTTKIYVFYLLPVLFFFFRMFVRMWHPMNGHKSQVQICIRFPLLDKTLSIFYLKRIEKKVSNWNSGKNAFQRYCKAIILFTFFLAFLMQSIFCFS